VTQLDENFRATRAQLTAHSQAQATTIWQASSGNRNRYLGQVLTLMDGATRAMVQLTSGYLTAKARETGHARHQALNLDDYTVEKLRGTKAVEVYARPYGALYGQLANGASEEEARASAVDALTKLAATDVHAAYTASARDWMAGDPSISAFKRVPSGTCDYCEAAAQGLYHPAIQMPIHENCECDLEPVFGAAAVAATGLGFHSGASGAVAPGDAGDLGSRLDTTGDVPAPPKKRRPRGRT
jgi:hypothetical protein